LKTKAAFTGGFCFFFIVFNQKVLHVFEAGEILKSVDELDTAFNNGVKLLKTLKLSLEPQLLQPGR
jgi:hypothetical protein